MARFHKVEAARNGWSEWQQPIRKGYKMACCDCGLVHDTDFRIHRGKIQFRARRNERSTAMVRGYHFRLCPNWLHNILDRIYQR